MQKHHRSSLLLVVALAASGAHAAPAHVDSDNDGLYDLVEASLGTNPFDADTDGDGKPDGDEFLFDADGDFKSDALESMILDRDHDAINDENDPADDDPCIPDPGVGACDADGDGIINIDEWDRGTDHLCVDSDGDGLSDGDEGTADTDSDGLIDALEANDHDGDDDGVPDHLDVDRDVGCVDGVVESQPVDQDEDAGPEDIEEAPAISGADAEPDDHSEHTTVQAPQMTDARISIDRRPLTLADGDVDDTDIGVILNDHAVNHDDDADAEAVSCAAASFGPETSMSAVGMACLAAFLRRRRR